MGSIFFSEKLVKKNKKGEAPFCCCFVVLLFCCFLLFFFVFGVLLIDSGLNEALAALGLQGREESDVAEGAVRLQFLEFLVRVGL